MPSDQAVSPRTVPSLACAVSFPSSSRNHSTISDRLSSTVLEVVIQHQDFDVASDRPFVASDKRWPVIDFDGPCL